MVADEEEQNCPPKKSLWHKDSFELKAIEKNHKKENITGLPLFT